MIRQLLAMVLVASASVACRPVAAQVTYTITDLGSTDTGGGPTGVVNGPRTAITDQVAGRSRGFLVVSGSRTDLGTLGGLETQTRGIGLNTTLAAAQIVGISTTASGSLRAFLWTQGGTNGVVGNTQMQDLGTLGGPYSGAFGVNASGRVTGYSANAADTDRAFLWTSGTMSDLGALVASGLGYEWSYGYGINATGQVAGVAYNATFANSFAWFYTGTSVKGLGQLGGGNAEAVALNDAGQIVGFSTNGAGDNRAFIVTGSTSMRDLGTLGGRSSFATGINNAGQVVGGSFVDAADSIYNAFVTVSGTMRNLNGLLDTSGQGWVLEEAQGINASGQIVGVGTSSGTGRMFLLTPAAAPLTWSGSGTQPGGIGVWSGTSTTWLSGTARTTWTGTSRGVFSSTPSSVTIAGSVTAGGGLEFKSTTTLTGGTLTLASGTFGVPPAVSVAGGVTASVISAVTGTSGLVKSGLGLLVLRGTNTLSGPTTVQSGTLRLATATALPNGNVTLGVTATLKVGSLLQLSLARLDLTAGGSVDVNDGLLTTASGLTPVSTVEKIREGLGDGSWNGTSGITSSAVAALVSQGLPRAIGWLDNGAGSMTVAFSAPGDTNIDGVVDILDAANFLALGKFDTGEAASWLEGDFSYDGIVDILDAADFLSTGLYDTGPYVTFSATGVSAMPAATFAVPEPSLVVPCMVAVGGLHTCLALSRGQRRQRTAAPGRA